MIEVTLLVGRGGLILAEAGRGWQRLAEVGLGWLRSLGVGRCRKRVAEVIRDWQGFAEFSGC